MLVALAALAVGGAASAQSSVTLFGVVDASVSSYSNKSENVGLSTLACRSRRAPCVGPWRFARKCATSTSESAYFCIMSKRISESIKVCE